MGKTFKKFFLFRGTASRSAMFRTQSPGDLVRGTKCVSLLLNAVPVVSLPDIIYGDDSGF